MTADGRRCLRVARKRHLDAEHALRGLRRYGSNGKKGEKYRPGSHTHSTVCDSNSFLEAL